MHSLHGCTSWFPEEMSNSHFKPFCHLRQYLWLHRVRTCICSPQSLFGFLQTNHWRISNHRLRYWSKVDIFSFGHKDCIWRVLQFFFRRISCDRNWCICPHLLTLDMQGHSHSTFHFFQSQGKWASFRPTIPSQRLWSLPKSRGVSTFSICSFYNFCLDTSRTSPSSTLCHSRKFHKLFLRQCKYFDKARA